MLVAASEVDNLDFAGGDTVTALAKGPLSSVKEEFSYGNLSFGYFGSGLTPSAI